MAEHIKLGSNPSSQYLPHLVCCYILYIFVYNTHNYHTQMMDHIQMRASHYSQTKSLIWGDLDYDASSRKKEIEFMEIMDFGLDIGDKRRENM